MAMRYIKGEDFIKLDNNKNIFYCHTHDAIDFFKIPPEENFILITHNSDGKITTNPKRFNSGSSNDIDFNQIKLPNNLIKWYGQNIDITNDIVESIPIGLENSMWFKEIKKVEKIDIKSKETKNIINLLYISHNTLTNPSERKEPYTLFQNKEWVTIEHGVNGQNFDNYLNNIHSHKFTLCPEGNGTDTHRTWETLYVGSIPIEKRNLNNRFYIDLPICFVDNWSDITKDFLNIEYERINNIKWNLKKLDFNYWETKIKNIL